MATFRSSKVQLLLTCLLAAPGAMADSDKRIAKVMTQNMDAGTDLRFVAALGLAGILPTYNEIASIDFQARAQRLAGEIASEEPDLISLQEVTKWTATSLTNPSQNLSINQLELLMAALASHKQHYEVVAVNNLVDVTFPVDAAQTLFLEIADHDVVLARSDLKQSELSISNVRTNRYQTLLTFTVGPVQVQVPRGWISADIKIRGKQFIYVNTHLESFAAPIQVAQATELLQVLARSDLPVVIAGDLNANAEQNGGGLPDDTATNSLILAAGYTDAWRKFRPGDPGFTWPLFYEDDLSGTPVSPFERIDLIYERQMTVLSVDRVGTNAPFAADHVGVVGLLSIGND